jgi:hypothetical protein
MKREILGTEDVYAVIAKKVREEFEEHHPWAEILTYDPKTHSATIKVAELNVANTAWLNLNSGNVELDSLKGAVTAHVQGVINDLTGLSSVDALDTLIDKHVRAEEEAEEDGLR